MKKRLFIAIELPPNIKAKIIEFQDKLKKLPIKATWAKPENIHLTLVFLGEIDYNQIPDIIATLDKLKDDAFEVSFSRLGGFPSLNKVQTLWLGIQENLALSYLQMKISKRLAQLDLKIDERKFIPHITVGRFKKPQNLEKKLSQFAEINFGSFKAKEFILFESELLSKGAKHITIKKFLLSQ